MRHYKLEQESQGKAEQFLKDTEDVLIQCLPHGIDLNEEQLDTLVRFVNSQAKDYARLYASEQRDEAAKKYHGEFANLNFK